MIERIIIAGAGGQGVMLLGKVLAQGALKENRFVTWFPCYGAEVRGGAAYCMVVISDTEIGSPYVGEADTLIIMNAPSWEKFKSRIKNKGLLIVNSSLVTGPTGANKQPFTDIASRLGNIKVANMVALGYYLGKKKILKTQTILAAIKEIAPADKKDLIKINEQAIKEGMALKR